MEDSNFLDEETLNDALDLANQGYAEAQNMLGHYYSVNGDYEKAIYWLVEAGKQDYFESILVENLLNEILHQNNHFVLVQSFAHSYCTPLSKYYHPDVIQILFLFHY